MGYALVLKLSFGINLVHKKGFENIQDAKDFSKNLPSGFEIIPREEATGYIIIPFYEERTNENRRSHEENERI